MVRVRTKLVSWEEIVEWCRTLARKIRESGYKPDVIIAVARGGFTPARLMCDFMLIEDMTSVTSQHWVEAAKVSEKAILKFPYQIDLRGKRALLVDDIADTGDSLLLAKEFIEENWKPDELRIAVMQWISPVCKFKPDYYTEEVREWIWYQYPWTAKEDLSQFLMRMFKEEGKVKREWTREEIVYGFRDWYGIDIDGRKGYLDEILEESVSRGLLEIYITEEGKVIYRLGRI